MTCEKTHLLLQADLDGELDAAAAAALSDHLRTCPACTALQAELTDLSARLRTGLTRHPAPASLAASLRRRVSATRRRTPWTHAASFGAGLAVAASLMLALRPAPFQPEVPDLVTAHIRALQPGHLLDVVSSDRHTVKPWFDGRVAFSPTVRDLAPDGFPLLGGRLDTIGGPPVAVLVYGRRKHLIDVFVAPGARPDPGPTDSGTTDPGATVHGYNTIGWTAGGLVYRAVSDLNPAELATFAHLMRAPS